MSLIFLSVYFLRHHYDNSRVVYSKNKACRILCVSLYETYYQNSQTLFKELELHVFKVLIVIAAFTTLIFM